MNRFDDGHELIRDRHGGRRFPIRIVLAAAIVLSLPVALLCILGFSSSSMTTGYTPVFRYPERGALPAESDRQIVERLQASLAGFMAASGFSAETHRSGQSIVYWTEKEGLRIEYTVAAPFRVSCKYSGEGRAQDIPVFETRVDNSIVALEAWLNAELKAARNELATTNP